VRLADTVFRSGHLSEGAIVEAVMTGDRPLHLDRCEICAERAVEVGRWMDQVRAVGLEAADAAFPAEQLAAQQAQIMRRLEQLDQPARVIAFPSQTRLAQETGGRRVAAGWLGVAAAAGLVLGVVGGQMTARVGEPAGQAQTVANGDQQVPAPVVTPPGTPAAKPPVRPSAPAQTAGATTTRLDDADLTRVHSSLLSDLEEATPRILAGRIR